MCQKDLAQVLRHLPKVQDPNVILGFDALGDAGVYALDQDRALVQTVDVLTPIADDPYTFGQIAAANSLSDVYAMGARPLTALNVVGFPPELDLSILEQLIRGGMDKVREAGAAVIGGHTIKDQELKYGLAVTGLVQLDEMVTTARARPGDRLVLTKPLGTGVVSTAMKAGQASPQAVEEINLLMVQLNRSASQCMREVGVNACTDITGFGFLGHLLQMLRSSKVGARIWAAEVPMVNHALECVRRDFVPGGTRKNFEYVQPHVKVLADIDPALHMLLCDAQTSGGLLMAVSEEKTGDLVDLLCRRHVLCARCVGEVIPADPPGIELFLSLPSGGP
ncbi:selenide, water dikinase SelD [bacterium]|nr:selenide, water dikinase SelD [bacterium]